MGFFIWSGPFSMRNSFLEEGGSIFSRILGWNFPPKYLLKWRKLFFPALVTTTNTISSTTSQGHWGIKKRNSCKNLRCLSDPKAKKLLVLRPLLLILQLLLVLIIVIIGGFLGEILMKLPDRYEFPKLRKTTITTTTRVIGVTVR